MNSPLLLCRSNTFVKENGEVAAAEDIDTVVQDISETSCSSTSTSPCSSRTTTTKEESSASVTSSSANAVSPHETGPKAELEPSEKSESEEVGKLNSNPSDSPDADSTRKPGVAEVPFSTPSTPRWSIPQPSPQDLSDSRKEATLIDDINNCFNLGSTKEGIDANAKTSESQVNLSASDSSSKVRGICSFSRLKDVNLQLFS